MAITHTSTYIRGSQNQVKNLQIGSFLAEINAFNAKALNNVDKAIRKMVFEVFKRIVMRTPTDSGRLRGAWQCSSAYSMSSELGGSPTYETKLGGTGGIKTNTKQGTRRRMVKSNATGKMIAAGAGTFDKSGSSTISRGRQFISSGMDIHDGLIAYIFNNVRYAIYLEGGRVYPSPPYGSPQAPRGMVRITLAEFGSISAEAVASVQTGGLGSGLGSGLGG